MEISQAALVHFCVVSHLSGTLRSVRRVVLAVGEWSEGGGWYPGRKKSQNSDSGRVIVEVAGI